MWVKSALYYNVYVYACTPMWTSTHNKWNWLVYPNFVYENISRPRDSSWFVIREKKKKKNNKWVNQTFACGEKFSQNSKSTLFLVIRAPVTSGLGVAATMYGQTLSFVRIIYGRSAKIWVFERDSGKIFVKFGAKNERACRRQNNAGAAGKYICASGEGSRGPGDRRARTGSKIETREWCQIDVAAKPLAIIQRKCPQIRPCQMKYKRQRKRTGIEAENTNGV